MNYSFPRYLLSKQSIDDRALNKDVLSALKANLPNEPLTIIEIGGGIGTMLARLLRWDVITRAEYTLVDKMAENIQLARSWLPKWAHENGLATKEIGTNELQVFDRRRNLRVKLTQTDVFDFIDQHPTPGDLLIAHAFLDLLPMPESLPKLLSLTENLAWLTLNFDGVTSLEPVIDPQLDAKIERLYHKTMDTRPNGGDSQSGRHLFGHLKQAEAKIMSAGASSWVVYPVNGRYSGDEAYFLQFILHFIEESMNGRTELDNQVFTDWLSIRRRQVERGELVYIAHQIDLLARV